MYVFGSQHNELSSCSACLMHVNMMRHYTKTFYSILTDKSNTYILEFTTSSIRVLGKHVVRKIRRPNGNNRDGRAKIDRCADF